MCYTTCMKIFTTPSMAQAINYTAKLVCDCPRDIDSKIYVFCESKASLSYEKQIAKSLGGSFNVEVLNFSRYVSKRKRVENYISSAQSALLVRKLMKQNMGLLKKFNPNSFSVPKDVYNIISQFKSAMIEPEDLKKIIDKVNTFFASKLEDIVTVYELYEDYLQKNNLTDESKYLLLMPELIKTDPQIKGAKVIISGIQSFTKQHMKIISTLSQYCDVDFVLVCANYEAFTNETINKVSAMFLNAPIIELEREFSPSQQLLSGLFNPESYVKNGKYSDKVGVIESLSFREECEKIASRIRYEVIKNGYRYKDFSVILQNVESYAPTIKEVFDLYEIPLYIDLNKNLDKHAVIGLIGALIDVKRYNFLPKKVLTLVKNGLFCTFDESQEFSSYMGKNAISRKQMKEPFFDLVCEGVRSKVIESVKNLKSTDTVKNYVEEIKNSLNIIDVFTRGETLSKFLKENGEGVLAEFNDSSLNAIISYLNEIAQVLDDTSVSLIEFKNIVISGASAVKISTIPEYNDTVYLGDYKAGRLKQSKILFCPALTFDVPQYKRDSSILNDNDLIKMDEYKLTVEPILEILNQRERENLAISLSNFTDKLYLSYSTSDSMGKPVLRSEIIDQVIQIFSDDENKLTVKRDIKTPTALNYMSKKAGYLYGAKLSNSFRERQNDDLTGLSSFMSVVNDSDYNDILLGSQNVKIFNEDLKYNGNLSPTFIENFFACPYKAFANNVLKLTETETGETKAYEIGNILHSVLENFVKNLDGVNDVGDATNLATKLYNETINSDLYVRYLNNNAYQHIFKLMQEEAVKQCVRMYIDIKNSDFKILGTELEFNESKKDGFGPIYIDTNEKTVVLRGKIDRADYLDYDGEKYVRIIDYKSGNAENDDSKFYSGQKIQLFLYMNVFTQNGYLPAATHYFKLTDDFSSSPLNGGEYLGVTLADSQIVGCLDKTFVDNGKSKNYKVTTDKNGFVKVGKSSLSKDQFNKYISYAKDVAKNGITEIMDGLFIPSPTETACDLCKYKGICGYDNEKDDFNRDVKDGTRASILNEDTYDITDSEEE